MVKVAKAFSGETPNGPTKCQVGNTASVGGTVLAERKGDIRLARNKYLWKTMHLFIGTSQSGKFVNAGSAVCTILICYNVTFLVGFLMNFKHNFKHNASSFCGCGFLGKKSHMKQNCRDYQTKF